MFELLYISLALTGSTPTHGMLSTVYQISTTSSGSDSSSVSTNLVADVVSADYLYTGSTNQPVFQIVPAQGWAVGTVKTTAISSNGGLYSGGLTNRVQVTAVLYSGLQQAGISFFSDFTPNVSTSSNRTAIGWTNNSLNYAVRTNLAAHMSTRPAHWTNTAVFTATGMDSNCWLASVSGLRSMAVTSSLGVLTGNGALISPYHLLTAAHCGSGSVLTWLTTNGTYIQRTNHSGTNITGTDIRIQVLTAPASNCEFVPLISPSLTNRFGASGAFINGGDELPMVFINQDAHIMLMSMSGYILKSYGQCQIVSSTWSNRWSQWTWAYNGGQSQVRGGDSGTPIYLCISNRLALAGTWWTAGGFHFSGCYTNEIQQAMDTLSDSSGTPRQTLQALDVGGFPAY